MANLGRPQHHDSVSEGQPACSNPAQDAKVQNQQVQQGVCAACAPADNRRSNMPSTTCSVSIRSTAWERGWKRKL